jgi:hypothetical protein
MNEVPLYTGRHSYQESLCSPLCAFGVEETGLEFEGVPRS